MTTDKLYEVLCLMVRLDEELGLQRSLEHIRDSLANLTNQPATWQYQSDLASALSALSDGADQLRKRISLTEWGAIDELGGSEYFDPSITDKVRTFVGENAITLSVAHDFVQTLATKRGEFLQVLKTSLEGLRHLLAEEQSRKENPPAEAAFVIPKDLFGNRLGAFGTEINFINQLMEHLSEAVTGEARSAELQSLSSSGPTVVVLAGLGALHLLGDVINFFLDEWEKIRKMRNVRDQVKELGLSNAANEEITETILTTVDEVVEASTRRCLANYQLDFRLRNELEIALKADFRRLFGQIERGLTVEIHTREDAKVDEDTKQELRAIAEVAQKMHFPAADSKEPILLTDGEVLEGELLRTKVTTTIAASEKATSKADVGGGFFRVIVGR
jgi:hypothetical protein